jgi:surface protein
MVVLQLLRFFSIILMITALIACGGDGSSSSSGSGGGGGGNNPTEPLILGGPGGNQIIATSLAVTGQDYDFEGERYTVVDDQTLKNILNDTTTQAEKSDRLRLLVMTRVTKVLGAMNDQDPTSFRSYIGPSANPDISRWDVSNFETMENLFNDLRSFNQDISNWDVSKVENMDGLFKQALNFTGSISNWNVSQVESMEELFFTTNFDDDISSWDVGNVKNMKSMLERAFGFDQDLSAWNSKLANVTNMNSMFQNTSTTDMKFNQDLSGWQVDNVNDCTDFSNQNTIFTEPNPTFNNCSP